MKVTDWRDAPYELLAPIYESERQQWLRQLQWDPASAWHEVERARTTWGLPGLLAVDEAGGVRGTAFFMQEEDRIDIGGLTADHVDATDALIEGVLASALRAGVRVVRAMLFDRAVALRSGLAHRRFEVEPHLYLSRSLSPKAPSGGSIAQRRGAHRSSHPSGAALLNRADTRTQAFSTGGWCNSDVPAAAALLRRAYDPEAGSLFAPRNEPAEWERYVRNLIAYPGCGTVNAAATRILREGQEIRAIALVTDIAPGAAHLVQLAVDPEARGCGLGATLVEQTCEQLAGQGYNALTLLVAQGNAPARALYDSAGFRHDATFLAATRRLS